MTRTLRITICGGGEAAALTVAVARLGEGQVILGVSWLTAFPSYISFSKKGSERSANPR